MYDVSRKISTRRTEVLLQHQHVWVSKWYYQRCPVCKGKRKGKGKGSPYSITERRVPELIQVLGSQPAGDVSHKPGGRLPLLSARPAVTAATLKRAASDFASWWTKTMDVNILPKTVTRQRRDCDLYPGPSAPESITLPIGYRSLGRIKNVPS